MQPDHLTIMVSSLDASMAFYDALLPLLGFAKRKEHIWSNGIFFLQFMQARAGTRPYERYGAGMNHIGFTAPDEAAVEAVRQAMQDAGFDVPDIQRMKGAAALFMKDPDGMRFEISHYPPGMPPVD
ncbi:VOC family protein [Croceicoccus marinus]|uniref:VOC family protein n=2 Tax=Croceicoccus marinus TaxID=450378 RepID=A0A7G6VXZ0_9SPHN|nr:VOC family protein [Croceicoccus marinus]